MAWFFFFFFISGFCSVLYELIWLRLSMAQFGVTTALASMVLSVFMAGLGLGSWIAGTALRRYGARLSFPPLRVYALLELLIGISAFVVPLELIWGHRLLEHLSATATVSSSTYYLISGLWLAATMIPWCACMGATIPIAMFAIRRDARYQTSRSFSFLYVANVLGAVGGSFLPLLVIELYGFGGTLRLGAILNAVIAVAAFLVSLASSPNAEFAAGMPSQPVLGARDRRSILVLLFTTGLATMGTELIWIRLFTPYIGPVVYSFGMILVAYLLATTIGARFYRWWSQTHRQESPLTWISLALFGVLPLLTADSRVPIHLVARVFVGVMPFAGMMGFLTPMLVDRWSEGDPDRAGRAYAVNVLGCIVGPLLAGFLLLPWVGEQASMLLLVFPWFAMAWPKGSAVAIRPAVRASAFAILLGALAVFFLTQGYERQFPERRVLRDATATVIAMGVGPERRLLVNGTGMTKLTPITKMMTHFTLASLDHEPKRVLVICFGMGTTFRSALAWGIPSTVVELVPSVPKLVTYYHPDGDKVLASPLAHVVIDDGRRFLERSPEPFDAIIIDPPPPVQTAGSSLLYSQDFYAVAKQRLTTGGILQQWLPDGDNATQSSVALALKNSFPYIRVYHGIEGWGWHFLASERPIPVRTSAELLARMPEAAVRDMMEWGPGKTPGDQFELLLSHPLQLDPIIALSPNTPALQDQRPINEYFLLRTPFDQLMDMQ
jgi:predicted membrane-bound spermidine synthase